MLGGVDPQALLEDPERRVPGHVQREQPRRADRAAAAEPHQQAGQGQVEQQLVQERRLEGCEPFVTLRPELRVDLQAPRQAGGLAEQLLVEVVAQAADGLGDQQGRRDRVHEQRHAGPGPAHPPGPYQRPRGDAAPHTQPARPHREHAPPVVRDVRRGGQVEVDPRADDAGRHCPGRHVGDQRRVAAARRPAPPGDDDGQGDPDHVHQAVEVNERRADMEAVHRRARDMQGHAPERRPAQRPAGAAGPSSRRAAALFS